MSLSDEPGPVSDEEYLYRKIPVSTGWYDPDVSKKPSPRAFHPRKNDPTDLSVDRATYTTIERAARGQSKQGYYVAILRVSDLRAKGMDVVPKPLPENPGHAEILGLNSQTRGSDQAKEWEVLLAHELTLEVKGPFLPEDLEEHEG